MTFTPLPPYFIVRIPIKDQVERKEKIGSIFIPPSYVFMTREVQAGQIVAIGDDAKEIMPEAKIGNILLLHHFVSGKVSEKTDEGRYLLDSDDDFNYYAVTCMSHYGRRNETYGVFDGKTITPHPEFIFFENEEKTHSTETKVSEKGIHKFTGWHETREQRTQRMQEMKFRAQELARSIMPDTDENYKFNEQVKAAIENIEHELSVISKKANKQRQVPFKIAAVNPIINEWFGREVKVGETVYCLEMASHTRIEFLQKIYRVVKVNYISFPEEEIKQGLARLKTRPELSQFSHT